MDKTETIGDNRYRVGQTGLIYVTKPNEPERLVLYCDGKVRRSLGEDWCDDFDASIIVEAYRLQKEHFDQKRKAEAERTPVMLDDVCLRLIEANGEDYQLSKMQEECGELVAAISQFSDERISLDDLCSEIADVTIVARVLYKMFPDRVQREMDMKLRRAVERLAARAKGGKEAVPICSDSMGHVWSEESQPVDNSWHCPNKRGHGLPDHHTELICDQCQCQCATTEPKPVDPLKSEELPPIPNGLTARSLPCDAGRWWLDTQWFDSKKFRVSLGPNDAAILRQWADWLDAANGRTAKQPVEPELPKLPEGYKVRVWDDKSITLYEAGSYAVLVIKSDIEADAIEHGLARYRREQGKR